MTITATASEIAYVGDGVTVAFAIPYVFDTSADIKVITTVEGEEPEVLSTGFSITGGSGSSGTCTFDTAPDADVTVTLLDDPELTQTADYEANDAFAEDAHEGALDRTVRQVKRLHQRVGRSLRVADGDESAGEDLLIPIVSVREGKFLAFDADGQPTVSSGTAGADDALREDLASAVASADGARLVGFRRTETGSFARSVYAKLKESLSVLDFGAVGDGVTDDSVAIQQAVDAAAVAGGTVVFPSDQSYKWGLGSQITVSSLYPVNLIGNMTANPNATVNASYIKPLNNITGDLIRYESPTASPADGGGGIIRGLAFMDDSNRDDAILADRPNYTMDAALGFDAFSLSKVENCHFHYLKGSAIRVPFAVMSGFTGLVIRYCGTTGKPAFDHPSHADNVMQSCVISKCRLEVNFDEPYIYMHGNTLTADNKIVDCGFESDPTDAPTSSQRYIDLNASHCKIGLSHFNRLGATYAVRLSGGNNEIVGCNANTLAGGFAELTGNKNSIIGGEAIAATSTIPTVTISGADGKVFGTKLYFANKIELTGARAKVLGVELAECTSADYLITATEAGFDISHVTISHPGGGRAVAPNGISVTNEGKVAFCRLTGNTAATGINVDSSNVDCAHNTFTGGYTTNLVPNGHMSDSIIERNTNFVTENKGQATVLAGDTSIVVTHGLAFTPSLEMIQIWPLSAWGSSTEWWISTATSTQFTINVDVAPGGGGMSFAWKVSPR